MKKNLFCNWLILIALLFSITIEAQMTIGGKKAPEPYSVLELTNIGGLRLPQLTTTQRDALGATALDAKSHGLFIYNTTTTCIEYWDSVRWVSLCDGTSQTVLSPAPCTTVNADGTGCTSTFTATDIDCPNGPYDIAIVAGADYASFSGVDTANGSFQIVFNENTTVSTHTVLVRVTTACAGMYKEFLFSQKGVDCTSMTYAPPVISQSPAQLGLCQSGAVYLSVPANTPNLDKLIWTRSGIEVARGVSHITATLRGKYNVSMGAIGCNVNASNERIIADVPTPIASNMTVTASNNGILCGTNSVTLSASGSTGTTSWFHDGKEDGRTGSSLVLTGDSSAGEWFAVLKDGNCYSLPSNSIIVTKSAATGQVVVNNADVLVNGIPLNTFTSFCMGGSLDLSVNNKLAGVTYTWYNGNEIISSNPFIIPATQNTISLRMVATDNTGVNCPAEANVIEKAITGGTAPAQPNITGNSTLCDGTTDLTIVPAVAGTYTYTWYKDNVKMPDTTPTITVNTPGVMYNATVTNTTGCTSTMAVKVIAANVSSIPKLTWQSQTTTATFGAKVTLQTAMEFGPAIAYTWAADNGATIVGSGSSITIQTPASGTDGLTVNVTVSATNNCGSSEVLSLPIVLNNACPTPTLSAQSPASQSVVAGSGIAVVVSGTKLVTPAYQWYLNTTASTTGGTVLSGGTAASYTYTPAAAGTYYLYCIVTNGCAGTFTATSPVFTVVATVNPSGITTGSGTFAGKTCFDIAESNDNSSCGMLLGRQSTKSDFTQTAVNSQVYTFTPTGTVSKVRFMYVESLSGAIINTIITASDPAALHIASPVTATVVYKTSLSTTGGVQGSAYGRTATNALSVDIYAVYNDSEFGVGTDKQVKLTATIKDCTCCGAMISATVFKTFMCHNLGADTTKDPFTPSPAIIGDWYQWGKKTPVVKQSNTSGAVVSGWPTAADRGQDGSAWGKFGYVGDPIKGPQDPCPAGYRVPTNPEWKGLIANNTQTTVGNTTNTSYGLTPGIFTAGVLIGNSLMLPFSGQRTFDNGSMDAYSRKAEYFSGDQSNYSPFVDRSSYNLQIFTGLAQNYGGSIRCIAEN